MGFHYGSLAWGDYDNDGDLDLATLGYTNYGIVSDVYQNDNGTFTGINAGLGVSNFYSLAWGDYDNDGDVDLAMAGVPLSTIYRNDNGTFTDIEAELGKFYYTSIAWGDYDNDGDLDLAIAGDYSGGFNGKIFRNDSGIFTDINAGLWGPSDEGYSLAWGDYDNDGDLDLAIAGLAQNTLFRNDGGTFTPVDMGLSPMVGSCSFAWGDYDGDSDLDVAVMGSGYYSVSDIYRNDGSTFNTPPRAPRRLTTSTGGQAVTFSWNEATDKQTPSSGLSYNLRVGKTPGSDDVLCCMADLSSGLRRIPAMGNVQKRLSWTIKGLPCDTYYWSVQAIDTAFAGSPWATEQSVVVTQPYAGPIRYVDDDAPTGNNEGSSWADAYNYLQDALAAAQSGDEIHVAQGVYKPDQGNGIMPGDRTATYQLINGVTIKGGYAGFGEVDPNARDIKMFETILSGDLNGDDVEVGNTEDLLTEPTRAENSYRLVLAHYWTDATAVLDGFTITGGNADGSHLNGIGAGIHISGDSTVTLANCTFTRNSSADWGGAVCNQGGPMLTNCVLTGNSARGGGGISSKHSESHTMTIINCIISGNTASERGGGIESWESHSIIVNSKIIKNSARGRGGGIYMDEDSSIALTGCTVSGNKAEGGDGGGLYARWYSYPLITNCIFWDNIDVGGVDESAQVTGSYQINYSCIQGWTGMLSGTGSIGDDPLFVDPDNDGYHLLPSSLCINTGDPNYVAEPNETDLDGKPRVIGGRIDMGAYEYSPTIPAEVRIVPQTINLASKGNWITCYIWLPEQYNVADIEPNSVLLEDEIKPEEFSVDEQQQIVMARFTREDVQPILDIGDIELTITGQLANGTVFEGTDTIKVIDKAGQQKVARPIYSGD
jgi:predicted outer membrane repeat protein